LGTSFYVVSGNLSAKGGSTFGGSPDTFLSVSLPGQGSGAPDATI